MLAVQGGQRVEHAPPHLAVDALGVGEKQELIKVEVLPKKLDEEVASYMVEGFGGVMTKLSSDQADYINVPEEGPFKSEIYKY